MIRLVRAAFSAPGPFPVPVWVAVLFALQAPLLAQPGFGGPSLLSRGSRPISIGGGTHPIRFSAHGRLTTGYATGIGRFGVEEDGSLFNASSQTATAGFGIRGRQNGRQSSTAASYNANYMFFTTRRNLNGLNQTVSVTHQRALTRQWRFEVGATGGQQNTILGLSGSPISDGIAPVADLTDELFDIRSYRFGGNAGVSYQHNARLTFAMSAGAFSIQRRAGSLASGTSMGGSAEMRYALDRRQQVGASYQRGRTTFQRGFGESNIHQINGTYNRILTQRWNLSLSAGIYLTRNERVASVAVDPLIQQLTGIRSALSIVNTNYRGLSAQAGLTGVYGRTGISFGYSRGVMPGNGLLLTSEQEMATANVSYLAASRLNIGAFSRYTRLKQLLGSGNGLVPRAKNYLAGGGLSYRLTDWLHLTSNAQLQRVKLNTFERTRTMITVGLSVSPGEFPIALF